MCEDQECGRTSMFAQVLARLFKEKVGQGFSSDSRYVNKP